MHNQFRRRILYFSKSSLILPFRFTSIHFWPSPAPQLRQIVLRGIRTGLPFTRERELPPPCHTKKASRKQQINPALQSMRRAV